MAGDLPKRSVSGRKQWILQDGPKNQIRVLRNQLANEGCSESQVVLAKQLLDEAKNYNSYFEKKENESLGVHWLIKASQQGNEEATQMLITCLKTGKGISEHNFLDVKSCIEMTQNEKLTKKAAREIFASLSKGRDYITTDQLRREMLLIEKNGNNEHNEELTKKGEGSSEPDWIIRLKSNSSGEKLTEDNLVSAAIDYSQGNLPLVNKSLNLDPIFLPLNDVPYVYRSILYPLLVLKKFHFESMLFFSRKLENFNSIPDIRLLFLVVIYSFINTQSFIYIFPIVLYYLSLIYMILTTFKMLQNQREFEEYRLWSGLFFYYSGGNFDVEQLEYQYLKRKLKPYGQFFLALIVNLLIYSKISDEWASYSELTIISFILTFLTLFGFMPKRRSKISCEGLVLFNFGITILAKYPFDYVSIVNQGWNWMGIETPMSITQVVGNGYEFFCNFRPVLFIAIVFSLILLASKHNWGGIYKFFIPHCVTLIWLHMCIIGSQGATMHGLIRGVIALSSLVMFLPFIGLTSIILPAITLTKFIITSSIVFTISIFILIMLISFFISFHFARSNVKKYTAIVQIVIMVISSLTIINMIHDKDATDFIQKDEEFKYFPWEVYRKFCYESHWEDGNVALSQLNCAGFENSLIYWDGYIDSIKLRKVSNNVLKILEMFPKSIGKYLRCFFDQEISKPFCENFDNDIEKCNVINQIKKKSNQCTLEQYNEYNFEIRMKMSMGIWGKNPDYLILVLDNLFKNITMRLKVGDHIWFKGKLFNNENIGSDGILGGKLPHISVIELGCHNCFEKNIVEVSKEDTPDIFEYVYTGWKFVLNVIFNPFVVLE